jgi:hypothetical protein
MSNPASNQEIDEEPYPEGYQEALADFTVLAVELLKKALAKAEEPQ